MCGFTLETLRQLDKLSCIVSIGESLLCVYAPVCVLYFSVVPCVCVYTV